MDGGRGTDGRRDEVDDDIRQYWHQTVLALRSRHCAGIKPVSTPRTRQCCACAELAMSSRDCKQGSPQVVSTQQHAGHRHDPFVTCASSRGPTSTEPCSFSGTPTAVLSLVPACPQRCSLAARTTATHLMSRRHSARRC